MATTKHKARNTAPVVPTTPPAQAPAAAVAGGPVPTYSLSAKAATLAAQGRAAANTLQRTAPGFGAAWRAHGKAAPNTRAQALAAIAAVAPCTLAQAQAALVPLHKAGILGSGTPGSYCKAFVANGYLAPC